MAIVHRISNRDVVARGCGCLLCFLAGGAQQGQLVVEIDGVLVLSGGVGQLFADHPTRVCVICDAEPALVVEEELRGAGASVVAENADDPPAQIFLAPCIPHDGVGVEPSLLEAFTHQLA